MKRDRVRRFNKFAEHYDGNLEQMPFLLKDCYNYHKWVSITSTIKEINFSQALAEKDYVDVSTLGSQACAGGVCELTF